MLLDKWQRGFPRTSRPFKTIGSAVGLSEMATITQFREWVAQGIVSRVGPVLDHTCMGASALVAMQVPAKDLAEVAVRVSALAEVNHNYEREHVFNLWFVLSCRTDAHFKNTLAFIERETGIRPVPLRMLRSHHIDLGFSLTDTSKTPTPGKSIGQEALAHLTDQDEALLRASLRGLDPVAAPYELLAMQLGTTEEKVLAKLTEWLDVGVFKRFGVVVRHRALGFTANAMCVWDVDDSIADSVGSSLACEPGVTLCYRRERYLPDWRYNLFCMIHGKARDRVLQLRAEIAERLDLDAWPHAVLFSRQSFKQRGAWWT